MRNAMMQDTKTGLTNWKSLIGLAALGMVAMTGCSKETPASNGTPTTGPTTPTKMDAATPGTASSTGNTASTGKKKIVFVFKKGGISYSDACKAGAQQANDDTPLNAEVTYQASDSGTSGAQADIIEQAIVSKVDAIVVSPVDSNAIIPSIAKATDAGIKVFTWDADAPGSKRQFYVAAVDDVKIGTDIADALAKQAGYKGKVLLVSGQKTAENLNLHLKGMEEGFKKYKDMTVITPTIYNDDKLEEAKSKVLTALQANPDVVGIACANSVSPKGAGEAVKTVGKVGKIQVWGLGLPSENKAYLKDGSISGLFLWDPKQLTYLTAKLVCEALDGKAPVDGATLPGVDGKLTVKGPIVTLPLRLEINKDNVDKLNF